MEAVSRSEKVANNAKVRIARVQFETAFTAIHPTMRSSLSRSKDPVDIFYNRVLPTNEIVT